MKYAFAIAAFLIASPAMAQQQDYRYPSYEQQYRPKEAATGTIFRGLGILLRGAATVAAGGARVTAGILNGTAQMAVNEDKRLRNAPQH